MKQPARAPFLVVAAATLGLTSACAPPLLLRPPGGSFGPFYEVMRLSEAYEARPADAPVAAFVEALPGCDFEEIAALAATYDVIRHDAGAVFSHLRAEARSVGGDALIGLRTVPLENAPAARMSATAVRYLDPACQAGA